MENKLIHGSHSCEPNPGPPEKNSSFKDKNNKEAFTFIYSNNPQKHSHHVDIRNKNNKDTK